MTAKGHGTATITTAAGPRVRDGDVIAVVRDWDGPNWERDVQGRRVSVGNALQHAVEHSSRSLGRTHA